MSNMCCWGDSPLHPIVCHWSGVQGVYSNSMAQKYIVIPHKWRDTYGTSGITWTDLSPCRITLCLSGYKCPYMVSRCSITHTNTTSISTINVGHISKVIVTECINSSPLVGPDPTTHSTVFSSTDREGC